MAFGKTRNYVQSKVCWMNEGTSEALNQKWLYGFSSLNPQKFSCTELPRKESLRSCASHHLSPRRPRGRQSPRPAPHDPLDDCVGSKGLAQQRLSHHSISDLRWININWSLANSQAILTQFYLWTIWWYKSYPSFLGTPFPQCQTHPAM